MNNYNPEWIKAWNANMDRHICLDYYAIMTYITAYYIKDESGTTEYIRNALKLMKFIPSGNVQNAFLTRKKRIRLEKIQKRSYRK